MSTFFILLVFLIKTRVIWIGLEFTTLLKTPLPETVSAMLALGFNYMSFEGMHLSL